jgi:hypothetical protein
MTVPSALPGPRSNRNRLGSVGRADDLTGSDIIVAVGDENGGTADDQFTLSSHGLRAGDYVFLLYKSLVGTVTGRVGTRFRVAITSANIFTLTTPAGTPIVNTADGTAVFLKGSHAVTEAIVQTVILPNLIVATGDFTEGTTEDMFDPSVATGYGGLVEADPLKLLYKAAAAVLTGIAVNTTVFAKSVTPAAFELAATAGGADIENTADGLAIFVRAG